MKTAKQNWRTTVLGALMLALSGWVVYSDPAKAQDPSTIATIAGGIGLIAAKDSAGTQVVPTQPEVKQ